jgi:hypothetical protein
VHPFRISSLGPIVLAAVCLGACAAGSVDEGDGNVTVEQGDDDAAADAAPTSDPSYGSDAATHPADASAPATGVDSGFPQPTGNDAGSPAHDSGSTPHDSGTTTHDSGSTSSGCDAPDTSSSCTACMTSGQTCQNNGCYNGYYCDYATAKCYSQSSCP